jgi:hypothetical protein
VSQPSIAIAPDVSTYFQEVLSDAIRVRRVEATDAASSYLVGLLCDYAHPSEDSGSTFSRPLTFQLRDALEADGPVRFKMLRSLGDHVLYAIGFFRSHIEGRGADRRYVMTVGSTAYREAAVMMRMRSPRRRESDGAAAAPDVLSELAAKFDRFAEVLSDVAEGTLACGARDERSVVKMYERWLKTGSSRLAEELGSHGILPSRGSGGVN